jgi:hypothetical protein
MSLLAAAVQVDTAPGPSVVVETIKVVGTMAAAGFAALATVRAGHVRREVTPNGGASMRDQLDRLERLVISQQARSDTHEAREHDRDVRIDRVERLVGDARIDIRALADRGVSNRTRSTDHHH